MSRRPAASPTLTIDLTIDGACQLADFDQGPALAVCSQAAAEAGLTGALQLNVRLIADAESQQLHSTHFSDPTTTDVMTFPDGSEDPETGLHLLGDLAVCVDVARRESATRQRHLEAELTLYILHGMLHLLDYDDRTDADRAVMWAAQVRLLATVGLILDSLDSQEPNPE